MILAACQEPADIKVFIEDPKVQEIIAAYNETVIIHKDSDDYLSLIPGYRKISGLDPNKYYMVESETDFTIVGQGGYPKFVTEHPDMYAGQLITKFGYITKIRGRTINFLTNNNIYTVRYAKPFSSATIPYKDNGVVSSLSPASVTDGGITIFNPTGDITINITGDFTTTSDLSVMAPGLWGNNEKSVSSLTDFPVEGGNRTVDYVFYNKSSLVFKVLSVTISSNLPTYGITLSQNSLYTFPEEDFGYTSAPTALPVTVTNAGDQPTGVLTVELSGTDSSSFTLLPTSIPSITAAGGTANFTVAPILGLSVKTHTATVKVYNTGNGISKEFDVSFTVSPANGNAGIKITFDITNDGNGVVSGSGNPASVSYDELLNDTKSLTFTATAWGAGAKWYLDGVLVYTGASFTINSGNATGFVGSLAAGKHNIDVFSSDGKNSGSIDFTITN